MTGGADRAQRPAGMGDPFLARVAGLPAEVMAPFRSRLAVRELDAGQTLLRELKQAREQLKERLHEVIPRASQDRRRFFLAVKRDCFNGRRLSRRTGDPRWPELVRRTSPLASRVLELEDCCTAAAEAFERAWKHQLELEDETLLALLDDRAFVRGVALASPDLVSLIPRLQTRPHTGWRRKERRLAASLLRYASRAAFKLSPFSSLTRVAGGELAAAPSMETAVEIEGALALGAGHWRERSLLRCRRFLLDPWRDLLLLHPAFLDGLAVTINDTLEAVPPEGSSAGRWRLLRPGRWEVDAAAGRLKHVQDARVRVKLEAPVLESVQGQLAKGPRTVGQLREALAEDSTAGGERAGEAVARLLQLGILLPTLPWPVNAAHLERQMLEALRALPTEAGLEAVTERLEHLVELQEGYFRSPRPLETVREIGCTLEEVWNCLNTAVGLDPPLAWERAQVGSLFEDVWLTPRTRGEDAGPAAPGVRLSRQRAEDLIQDLDPFFRFATLFSPHHDFRHAVAATMDQRWPGRQEVAFLELFETLLPLWADYRSFVATRRRGAAERLTFAPFQGPAVERLEALRQRLRRSLTACVRHDEDDTWVCGRDVERILATAPRCYEPPLGPCLLLQTADREGRLWVLNRMFEGTGRHGSRFTAAMEEEERRRYLSHFRARSSLEMGDRRAELLDLMSIQGDTLNVHDPQTRWVLDLPGHGGAAPPEQRLRLRDLRVRRDPETGLAELRGADGTLLIPVHLGAAGLEFMPTVVKVLSQLGVAEVRVPPVAFLQRTRQVGPVKIARRVRTEAGVILARKRWIVPAADLVRRTRGLTEPAALAEIHRWRCDAGIPERVFWIEPIPHPFGRELYKPQYIDFTSPSFAAIFRSAAEAASSPLEVEEVLPTPESFPRDGEGRRWAVELMLDTLALRPRAAVGVEERWVPKAAPPGSSRHARAAFSI